MKKLYTLFFLIIFASCETNNGKTAYSQIIIKEKTNFNMLLVGMKFINKENLAYKDIDLVCEVFAPSGTSLGKKTQTIYRVVNANSELIVGDINMGFVNSQIEVNKTECRISGIVWVK
jgi:hypothetical protein